jgi:competence protein ComGC
MSKLKSYALIMLLVALLVLGVLLILTSRGL